MGPEFVIYRQKLRRLEVALIEFRESLEERGIKSSEEIERRVAAHRKRLQFEYGLSDPNEESLNSKSFVVYIIWQFIDTAGYVIPFFLT